MKFKKWLILPIAMSFFGLMASCGSDDSTPVCGNGTVETGEQCDDGNQINDDACSNACMTVEQAVCGDGVLGGDEQCDDGNQVAGDGCENDCTVTPITCGNGTVEAGEECDDGNFITGDACTNACKNAVCGDGILQVGVEACDDGNQDNTDSCLNDCTLNVPADCGNGILDQGEECDDGNAVNDDACTNACTNAVCGDGITQNGVEECDDGNAINGDGCEDTCIVTPQAITLQQMNIAQAIPDDGYDGTIGSMSCVKFTVPVAPLNTFLDGSLRIGIIHSQVGNLVIKVVPPVESDTITVLNRPGFTEAQDDGTEPGAGDDSDISALSKINFIDDAAFDAELMGEILDATHIVCLDDNRCNYKPNAGAAGIAEFSSLISSAVDGDWMVCVGDAEAGEIGTLESVELFITKKL